MVERESESLANATRVTCSVLSVPIDVLDWSAALSRIAQWAAHRQSRYVCICNVHSVVTAARHSGFRQIVQQADMAAPDGAPVAAMLRATGYAGQQRINGPDLMWKYCERAAAVGESIYLLGGKPATLAALHARLLEAFPGLIIAGSWSPPFRALTPEEDHAIVDRINASGAATIWVGLGCPKQERWMAEHRGRICAVMIGVGAAFDYHAGSLRRAPRWIQACGFEWLYRLAAEPRRLWKRYLVTNSLFIAWAAWQLLSRRLSRMFHG
ncbi:WecB/TagA/CpsF family glycosyltransferase [Noviherbaspirillum sp. 1P10PC]|uniref:WecB/TagA/CpsF family glycosyltransferase n=1 Tax=Noviherbaspirillum sp. 1P10PC TaxID=3132292 RepID=UPI0039A225BC